MTLTERFAAQVAATPNRPAVVTPQLRWSYAELDRQADRVARGLVAAGLRPGDRCALLFRHGAAMIAGVLGALRARLAYVPLDASYPVQRLAFMLDDSGAAVVLTDAVNAELGAQLAAGRPLLQVAAEPSLAALPTMTDDDEAEAYLLYTSGSTGRPKPVVQIHRNVVHHADAWITGLGIGPADRVSLQSAYSWDSAVQDTFAALLSGAALYPVDLKAVGISGLLDWLIAEQVTVYHSTLPIFRALCRALEARQQVMPSIRVLALGGDLINGRDLELYRRWFSDDCRLANAYGSTECSCALLRVIDKAYRSPTPALPLGSPVPETTVELIGGGEAGELLVRSRYLAPGHGRPGPDGDPNSYRTGDLAHRMPDGTLVLAGRADLQLKISGIRVDLGEVESILAQQRQVREVVVNAFTDLSGERQLAAYLVAEPELTVQTIRAFGAGQLPDHALPTAYVFLPALPLTVNHKIDRAALPDPISAGARPATAFVAPGNDLEQTIAAVWRDVLGVAPVGVEDNFFDLGGTSLRMAAVHEQLSRGLDRPLRMVDLYRAATVRGLARLLAGGSSARAQNESAARRGTDRRRALTAVALRAARRPPANTKVTVAPDAKADHTSARPNRMIEE